jgi:hypothetical protein
MNALTLAKRRAARRHLEGGAAMFVVAMTIAVLASVGVYALAAAATEVRTSGNERQNTQTHYLAEYGVIGSAQMLSSTTAQLYRQLMKNAQHDTMCLSLQSVPSTNTNPANLYCKRIETPEFSNTWGIAAPVDSYGGNAVTPYTAKVAPGSFGNTPMVGDFFVELTEPVQLRPKRYSDQCAELVTVTSYGRTQPIYPTITGSETGQFGGEGVEVQRARLLMQPVPCEGSAH